MDIVIYLIYFAWLVGVLGIVLGAVGIVWAPFGALICARIADTNTMNWRTRAVVGALYSASGFVPWLLLFTRMQGKDIYPPVIILGYGALFAAWLLGLAFLLFVFIEGSTPIWVLWDLTGIGMWCVSLWKLVRSYRWDKRTWTEPSNERTLGFAYAMPFLFALVWLVPLNPAVRRTFVQLSSFL